MAIISNYLLFNHTYLRQLQADSSVDDEASIAAQGVRELIKTAYEGRSSLRFMGIAEHEGRGSYHTKVYTEA